MVQVTGILSMTGRGANTQPTDLLWKACALLMCFLFPALGLMFTYRRGEP